MASNQTDPEHNVALMRRLVFEMQETGNTDLVDAFVHPDFINHTGHGNNTLNNRDSMKTALKVLHGAFKDVKMEIIQCIGQGNVVATNKVLRGRHVGDFMGNVASGKMVEFPIMDFVTFRDGLIVEHWARAGPVVVVE